MAVFAGHSPSPYPKGHTLQGTSKKGEGLTLPLRRRGMIMISLTEGEEDFVLFTGAST
jgi:hypothetical protein